jgi:two-component system chemotaxis sensor kinase CheA
LVDDSLFFRNLLTPLLSVAGYDVTAVESPDRALVLREQGLDFDIIVSDIEMPGMSGFEFANSVRSDPRWQNVPMIALSSHATEKDFERGRRVGFNDYVSKSDRDALLQTMSQTLSAQEVIA